MASFGIGELPDGGGSEVYNARRGPGKENRQLHPYWPIISTNFRTTVSGKRAKEMPAEIPADNDPRLKLARGVLPQGTRGKVDEKVKKSLPTESAKAPSGVR